MRKYIAAAAGAALITGISACGGYSASAPTAPAGASSPPADAIVISIVGINGAQSFAPNPSTVPPGRSVVWHNVDTTSHRVVLDDGELDTGNITPGGFSAAMPLVAAGPYHCSVHPVMIGRMVDGR